MSWAAAGSKTAVVTGVARPSGIGHACAALLYQKGYSVLGIDVAAPTRIPAAATATATCAAALLLPWQTPQQYTAAAAAHAQTTAACVFLQLDLAQPAAVLEALPRQLRELGITQVHVLVNNAAIAQPYMPPAAADGSNAAQRAELWSKYIEVNLSAPFLLTEALLPLLTAGAAAPAADSPGGEQQAAAHTAGRQGSSSIIHISSTRALQSEPHCEGYGAAKAGLLGLTHAQAASLADRGIRVNTVLPGWIDTEEAGAAAGAAAAAGAGARLRPEDHAWHWANRVGVPGDVASMVAFLADGASSGFITGQQFVVCGGVSKRMTYPE